MRLIISPAKGMEPCESPLPMGRPAFLPEAERLTETLRAMGRDGLRRLWKTSDPLTEKALAALDAWSPAGCAPAVLAYRGIQYTRMAPSVMTEGQLAYLQGRLRILSGLYGALRPFDAVAPYRLEMGARLAAGAGWGGSGCRDLYGFWGPRLARALFPEGEGLLVNAASKEYARAVLPWLPAGVRCVTCLFGTVADDGRWVQRATAAKEARGTFVRWCAERGVEAEEELATFAEAGYLLDRPRSSEDGATLVFTRR
ncbi:YaaA family protein [Atopobiaceae bacterium 24-176]